MQPSNLSSATAADELPAHASPALEPQQHHNSVPVQSSPGYLDLNTAAGQINEAEAPPPALVSPAFTPPETPGTGTPAGERNATSVPLDTSAPGPAPKLLPALPHVECVVRARIPLTSGREMYLHLYKNDLDGKEHLAIVFGDTIRSRSLDEVKPNETEQDRMIRGAYVGRLYPGRVTSGMKTSAGTASPLLKSMHKPVASHPAPASLGAPAHPAPIEAPASRALDETAPGDPPLVRIHSECYTGETVWSARCDCGEQLDEAARLMALPQNASAGGVIVYLRQEGRGIGLGEKLKAYNLQDLGNDTVEANLLLRHPADARSYGLATAILCDLGLGNDTTPPEMQEPATPGGCVPDRGGKGIRLLTNNPDKVRAVEGHNREIVVRERVEMVPLAWKGGAAGIHSKEVEMYLSTKIKKMGHLLSGGA